MSNSVRQEFRNKISDAFPKEDCLDIEQLAKEMGIGVLRARQIVKLAIDKRHTQNLTKFEGRKALYPEPMVKAIMEAYDSGKLTSRRRNNSKLIHRRSIKNAQLVLEVPVYDEKVRDILLQQFGDEEKIIVFLTDQLLQRAQPVQNKLAELEAEFEAKKRSILQIANMNSEK